MEGVQGQNAALMRPHPENVIGLAAFGHGKNSQPVGEQQFVGIYRGHARTLRTLRARRHAVGLPESARMRAKIQLYGREARSGPS